MVKKRVVGLSHFIPEPRNFSEVIILPAEIKNAWLKSTLKYIKNLSNNQTFQMKGKINVDPVTPCMNVYKAKKI